jgi:hypothetical protein
VRTANLCSSTRRRRRENGEQLTIAVENCKVQTYDEHVTRSSTRELFLKAVFEDYKESSLVRTPVHDSHNNA